MRCCAIAFVIIMKSVECHAVQKEERSSTEDALYLIVWYRRSYYLATQNDASVTIPDIIQSAELSWNGTVAYFIIEIATAHILLQTDYSDVTAFIFMQRPYRMLIDVCLLCQ